EVRGTIDITAGRGAMTTFTVDNTNSVFASANNTPAFAKDSAAADSLIVIEGGYLVASGAAAPGALLANTGPWTVTIDGAGTSTQDAGISLAAGNAKIST